MGQRLNIEIHEDGKLLANSYFHWSAYTGSAIELTREILDQYNECVNNNPIQRAVKLLELTGAGITEEEKSLVSQEKNELLRTLKFCRTSNNRNQGFIHVLTQPMLNVRDWDEGRVVIDIYDESICFDVVHNEPTEYRMREDDIDEDDLPDYVNTDEFDCYLGEAWTFDQFYVLADLYEKNPDGFRYKDFDGEDMVAYWIE